MKSFISICIVLSMLLALASCGGDTTTEQTTSIEVSSQETSEVVSSEETSSKEPSSTAEESVNIALNRRVYCSSENTTMLSLSRFAVDGDDSTYWASNTTAEQIEEWIMIDLGENYSIEEIVINWGRSCACEYSVELSRGGLEFTEVYSTSEGAGSTETIAVENEVGRYVRINCKKVVSILGGYTGAAIKDVSVAGAVSDDQTLGSEKEAMVVTKIVQPTENDVYVMGRNYKFNELVWAGAVYEYKCTGSVAGAVITTSTQFEVSIDGGEFVTYPITEITSKEFIFADDLDPDKEHVIRIMKSKDIWSSAISIQGVIIVENADIVKDYARDYALKIEFIGDSITSGTGASQFAKSYVYTCASILNANYNVVSRSGQGLYRHVNFGSSGPLKSLYAGIGAESGDYDYSYDADLVVLNIGTNDGANVRQTTAEADKQTYRDTFEKMYIEMLEIIHNANPRAVILCTAGQMGDYKNVKTQIESAIDTYKQQNPDVEVHLFYMSAATDANADTTWHPGTESHIRNGNELAEEIKRIMNIK